MLIQKRIFRPVFLSAKVSFSFHSIFLSQCSRISGILANRCNVAKLQSAHCTLYVAHCTWHIANCTRRACNNHNKFQLSFAFAPTLAFDLALVLVAQIANHKPPAERAKNMNYVPVDGHSKCPLSWNENPRPLATPLVTWPLLLLSHLNALCAGHLARSPSISHSVCLSLCL